MSKSLSWLCGGMVASETHQGRSYAVLDVCRGSFVRSFRQTKATVSTCRTSTGGDAAGREREGQSVSSSSRVMCAARVGGAGTASVRSREYQHLDQSPNHEEQANQQAFPQRCHGGVSATLRGHGRSFGSERGEY
jgi:hypothetical protein